MGLKELRSHRFSRARIALPIPSPYSHTNPITTCFSIGWLDSDFFRLGKPLCSGLVYQASHKNLLNNCIPHMSHPSIALLQHVSLYTICRLTRDLKQRVAEVVLVQVEHTDSSTEPGNRLHSGSIIRRQLSSLILYVNWSFEYLFPF